MVHIDGVDVGAGVEQYARHFDVGSKVERKLAVAAARVNGLRVLAKDPLDLVDQAKTRRGV